MTRKCWADHAVINQFIQHALLINPPNDLVFIHAPVPCRYVAFGLPTIF